MKYAFALVAIGASMTAAQDLASLPGCGQTCIGNMLGLAPSLGCDGADAACLCRVMDFGYGVRDCANQACGNASDAQVVIAYGVQYCSTALPGAESSSAPGAAVLGGASGSSDSMASMTMSGSAIATSALTALVSGTDSSFITTTGFTTIYDTASGTAAEPTGTNSAGETTDSAGNVVGGGAAAATGTNSAGEMTDSMGSVIASATQSASEASSRAEQSATSALNSASESVNSALSSATDLSASATSTSSDSGAAMMTAAPMLAAGILAMLAL